MCACARVCVCLCVEELHEGPIKTAAFFNWALVDVHIRSWDRILHHLYCEKLFVEHGSPQGEGIQIMVVKVL